MNKNLKLTFHSGAKTVTGANFILETMKDNPHKIMIDCGLIQGGKDNEKQNKEPFPYKPSEVKALIVTHAHIDHIGRIPKLVKDGFNGTIYSTPATKEMAKLMFDDAYKIMTYNMKKTGEPPIYQKENILDTMSLWKTINYHKKTELGGGFSVYFKDAGHILGSIMAEVEHKDPLVEKSTKILFTGDLGNSPEPLLRNTETIGNIDYIIMESVYGDRNHESSKNRLEILKKIIEKVITQKGTLLIPTFSLEKTQVILFELNKLIEDEQVGPILVFLDSPLAIKATEIYKKYGQYFNKKVQNRIKEGDDIFDFPKLDLVETTEESRLMSKTKGAKIIMAGSGMSMGGRVIFHEKELLSNPNNTMLFVGYQVPGTLGRQILDGNGEIRIFNKKIKVKAKIEKIMSYSSHKDSDNLVEFVGTAKNPTRVFVAMGEPRASMFLAQKIKDHFNIEVVSPDAGDSFIL